MSRLRLLCVIASAHVVTSDCGDHCLYPCVELNGPLHVECADCSAEAGHLCYPGASDFDTWKERSEAKLQSTAVGAQGGAERGFTDPDTVELTHKSFVVTDKHYVLATPRRNTSAFEQLAASPEVAEFIDESLPVPEESPRSCEVHSCVLIDGDDACAEGRLDCDGPRGHLRPFGEQYDLINVAEHDMRSERETRVDATYFWRKYVLPYEPVLLRGLAHEITNQSSWTDAALLDKDGRPGHAKCERENGRPWYVTVEVNNRISHNDRWPLLPDWDFCRFVREYQQPEAPTYCINSITEDYRGLTKDLGLPRIMACDDLYGSMQDMLIWFSKGNTTSSQHFDTEDNIMFQISGTKDIYLR